MHTLGIIEKGFDYIIITGSVGLLAYGFYQADGISLVYNFIFSKKEKKGKGKVESDPIEPIE